MRVSRIAAARAWAIPMVAALTLGACGSDEDYANEPRPPAPITIAAAITDRKISVSPTEFGAGPVTLIVSNQTKAAQKITLETDELGGTEAGLRQTAGPIAPSGTATLKVDLREGTYKVSADGAGVKPAGLDVGPLRESSQNDLLLP
jgi:hypothetical protein